MSFFLNSSEDGKFLCAKCTHRGKGPPCDTSVETTSPKSEVIRKSFPFILLFEKFAVLFSIHPGASVDDRCERSLKPFLPIVQRSDTSANNIPLMRLVQSFKHSKRRDTKLIKEGWMIHYTNRDSMVRIGERSPNAGERLNKL